ncbi:MAG: metalloregulator ArsR/SmtB family transcription factor [Anaerovoracaceae bacterium]
MDEMEKRASEVADLLKVLANENRLLILCELSKEPQCVGSLLEKLNISQSGLSQHLSILKANGILDHTKKAQNVIYSLKDERVIKLLDVLNDTYCGI